MKNNVLIVMAVYNGECYLEQQLSSIAEQTFTDWKLIIRDDGSTDSSYEIMNNFAEKFPDNVRCYKNQPSTGSAKNNFALLLQDAVLDGADYVMCCDQDDLWKKNKIEVTLKKMKQLENTHGTKIPLLVHGDLEVVDEKGVQMAPSMFRLSNIEPKTTLSKLLVQNNVTGCTMMMNQVLVKGIADASTESWVIMHDYLAALYAMVFGETGVVRKPLLSYRQHGNNSVGAKSSHSLSYLWKRFREGRKNYKKQMEQSYDQVAAFSIFYQDELKKTPKSRKLLEQYGKLSQKRKLDRILFYVRNCAWKKGAVRKMMQILWG